MAKVAKWKAEEVEKLRNLLLEYPMVGVVNMENMPSKQLQKVRGDLRGDVLIKVSKKSLMLLAIEKASKEEKGLEGLGPHVDGQAAFVFSKMNPFRLYKILEKNKANAPVKANSIAPMDIIVHKGETPFPPGPFLGELQQAGIKAAIQSGKISIKEDRVVAREGGRVSPNLAAVLSKLEIEPLEIGLGLRAAYENKVVYTPDILAVDTEKVVKDIRLVYTQASNLSINSGFLTKDTAQAAIFRAFNDARNLAINAAIFEGEVMESILSKAQSQAMALKVVLGDSIDKKLGEIKAGGGLKEEVAKGKEAKEGQKEEVEKIEEEIKEPEKVEEVKEKAEERHKKVVEVKEDIKEPESIEKVEEKVKIKSEVKIAKKSKKAKKVKKSKR